MKVLLDECVDSRLTASLGNFEVRTVADEGWVGISNGQLLSLAAAKFDVFVTVDRNRKGRRGHSDWRSMIGYKPTDNWGQFRGYFFY